MEVDALTYFYPEKDWKGEFGFDEFAYNFDNIGQYVSPALCAVRLEGVFDKDEEPIFKQIIDHNRLFPLRGEKSGYGTMPEFARFNIKKNGNIIQDYAICENGECYFYMPVPFTDRRKMVDFDFKVSDSEMQHFLVWYDAEGKVEELTIVSGKLDKDWQLETCVFHNQINEVLAEDNVNRLHLDTELIERIYRNEDMVSDSLSKEDKRIQNLMIVSPSSEIHISYDDKHKVAYKYESAQLCKVMFKTSEGETKTFSGSQEQIIKNIKEANIPVIDELLTNPFYNHPASVKRLDEGIDKVLMVMNHASTVKCKLEVEQANENASFVNPKNNEIKDFVIEVYKVKGGQANLPRSWDDNSRIKYESVDYGGGPDLTDAALIPLWRQYVDKKYFLKKCDGKIIFYPIPSLSLTNYAWDDRRRGVDNDAVMLHANTIGNEKVHYEVENEDVFDFYTHDEIDEVPEGSVLFVANHNSENGVKLKVTNGNGDDDENQVGLVNVHVFEPIHLKLCIVNVNCNTPRPVTNRWNYKKDHFIEILGQAGIIFDEIDDTKSILIDEEVFSDYERWDDDLKDFVLDNVIAKYAYGYGIKNYIDDEFLEKYREYAGYLRVYVVDKYLVDASNPQAMRLVTVLLDSQKPPFESVLLFKKSIDACDATESNPFAYALLRCLGLQPFANPDCNGDDKLAFKLGASTNMMDNSDCRYTLTSDQWLTLRKNAKVLLPQLQLAEDIAKSK